MGDSEGSGVFEELGIPTEQDFTYQYVEMEITGNVAWLTMKRPPYNVLTADMMIEMARAIGELHDERSVRVIVLQASPECTAFSAGVAVEDSRP
ncbi:MAG: enoyl-CoA hydratase-related protein, partial [Terriglobia bacterium]